MRVVRPWPRLPREAVAAPSLTGLKARLDRALSTLGWWEGSLPMAGGLEPDDLQGPFQPKPFYESMVKSLNWPYLLALLELEFLTRDFNPQAKVKYKKIQTFEV